MLRTLRTFLLLAGLAISTTRAADLTSQHSKHYTFEQQRAVARLLSQATLGWNYSNVDYASFNTNDWINNQLGQEPTLTAPYINELVNLPWAEIAKERRFAPYHKVKSSGNHVGYLNASTAWMRAVVGGNDALRQRVAWALSQILVVSNDINKLTFATSDYYDLMINGAFGSYEDLLLTVTMHPVMGRYLSYLGNQKARPKIGRFPDENYAREVMQLFSIGLWQLNDNGTLQLDENSEPIPTYTIDDVKTLAKVFTGLWLDDTPFGRIRWSSYNKPMRLHDSRHDRSAKIALDGWIDLPANQTTAQDIQQTIAALANHPNTAPFIVTRLINHLVTSNPSKEYVGRVVGVWKKTNGQLSTVVQSILLDPEARLQAASPSFGRLKDPIQRITSIIIAYDCGADLGTKPTDYPGLQWWHPYIEDNLPQSPMRAPSVFSFFEPGYQKNGVIAEQGLVSPEFQIHNDVSSTKIPNYIWDGLEFGFHRQNTESSTDKPLLCNFSEIENQSLSAQVRFANLALAAGNLDAHSEQEIIRMVSSASRDTNTRAKLIVYAVAISPEAAVQY